MIRYWVALVAMTALLAGCAGMQSTGRQPASYAQRYAHFDAQLAWNVRDSGSATAIDGAFKNVRYVQMNDIDIWVRVLDDRGKTTARAVGFPIPQRLGLDETGFFTVKLPVRVEPGTTLSFTYKYEANDGGGNDGGGRGMGPWMQSFKVKVP